MLRGSFVYFLLSYFLLISCVHKKDVFYANDFKNKQKDKKRVLIYYNQSGGAHVSTTKAIEESLGDSFEVITVNFSNVYFDKGSFISWASRGKYGTDYWYNKMLKGDDISLLNFLAGNIIPVALTNKHKKLVTQLKKDISEIDPDLIISTIPMVNGFIGTVAEDLQKPFLITALDADPTNWAFGLENYSYNRFLYVSTIYSSYSALKLKAFGFKGNQIASAPYPIRDAFFHQYSREVERKELGIPEDSFVLMLLMGGAGSSKIVRYADIISRKFPEIYILACVGNSLNLKKKLARYARLRRVKVIGFTTKIPEIMISSDVILTKPGPTTIMEALASRLPLMIDGISKHMLHEKAHLDFVLNNNFGVEFTSRDTLLSVISDFSKKEVVYKDIKENMSAYHLGYFRIEFKKLVEKFLLDSLVKQ